MLRMLLASTAVILGLVSADVARAEGELQIYNWGDYTSPELLKKFEDTYKVKVTVTEYDSNDTALAKVRAGGSGYDIVVPSANFVPIWIKEGLLLESRPDQMENFKNVDPKWINVPFDPGRKYTVPWQWFVTGITVNTSLYSGDINTFKVVMDPPPELVGKVNIVPEMMDVMAMAILYEGGELCTDDKTVLKKARDALFAAKSKWVSIDFADPDKYAKGDLGAGLNWNGWSFRARLLNDKIAFGFPKEGFIISMDNVAILKDAKNVENAKLFQNFIMAPENAGLISTFARYGNGIMGSEAYMPEDMRNASKLTIPKELADKGHFAPTCSPEVTELYTKIWTELQK